MKRIESCVTPEGEFKYGIHKPRYRVTNLRNATEIDTLGRDSQDNRIDNRKNYPDSDIEVDGADWIFEIPNPLPFQGRTFIDKEWADTSANNYDKIRIPAPPSVSLTSVLAGEKIDPSLIEKLPEPILLSLATSSTDKNDLITLARISCDFLQNDNGSLGLRYKEQSNGKLRAVIHKHQLFETVANNPHLPDDYKIAMVIRPGAQGGSKIVGDSNENSTHHVYEYLRRNSYIAGGHYAANMSDNAIRYSIAALQRDDLRGSRHLYYQRTFVRLAQELGLQLSSAKGGLTPEKLELLRQQIVTQLHNLDENQATLWGWNFGFDYAPTGYRLHASHQQIHQQYAMVPPHVVEYRGGTSASTGKLSAYCCGDLIAEVIENYRNQHDSEFFVDYQKAIQTNTRMDDRSDLSSDLVVFSDDNVILFVPKAQTSQWELQLMPQMGPDTHCPGNIVECNREMRESLDTGIYKAQKALAGLGAQMVTSIEYSKRLSSATRAVQPLLYAFLPRLPESPGAFSEAQLRFINGHYPEDFAAVCRKQLAKKNV